MTDLKKPNLWNQALKAVKGETAAELVEQFTSEMTLVAEGLCEDQARLRSAVDGLIRQCENTAEREKQDYQELSDRLDALETETNRKLKDIARRLDVIDREREKAKEKQPRGLFGGDALGRITVLAGIVCGAWVLVTILKLFM